MANDNGSFHLPATGDPVHIRPRNGPKFSVEELASYIGGSPILAGVLFDGRRLFRAAKAPCGSALNLVASVLLVSAIGQHAGVWGDAVLVSPDELALDG